MISETERRIKILDYILKKITEKDPKITKSDIMRHLKDSRPMTTHKITIELIKEGKIKMVKPKYKPYSRIDYLIINPDNEFNKIYKQLSEIEVLINKMEKNMRVMKASAKKKEFITHFYHTFTNYFLPYNDSIDKMLRVLTVQINEKIHSDKDLGIFHTKIMRLMSEIGIFTYDKNILTQLLDNNAKAVTDLQDPQYEDGVAGASLRDDLVKTIENFKKEFLSENEQKTAEPHEKSS